MATVYHPFKLALTDGQEVNLRKAFANKTAVTLRVKHSQIGHGDDILLTTTQVSRRPRMGAVVLMSK